MVYNFEHQCVSLSCPTHLYLTTFTQYVVDDSQYSYFIIIGWQRTINADIHYTGTRKLSQQVYLPVDKA
jgi:hypothetical protein